jgi:hypothetical protein
MTIAEANGNSLIFNIPWLNLTAIENLHTVQADESILGC